MEMKQVADIATPKIGVTLRIHPHLSGSHVRRTCVPVHVYPDRRSMSTSRWKIPEPPPISRSPLGRSPPRKSHNWKTSEQMFDSRAERPYDVSHDRS